MTFDPSNFLLRWKWVGWCRLNIYHSVQFSSVQLLSPVWLFATPWTEARQAYLSTTNSWSLQKLMSIELVMQSNHLILCYPLLPAFSLFQHQGLFKWVSSPQQVAKAFGVSASTSVPPMNTQDWSPLETDIIKEFQLHSWPKKYNKASFFHLWHKQQLNYLVCFSE